MEITDIKKNGMIPPSLQKPVKRPSKKEELPVQQAKEKEEITEFLRKISNGNKEAVQGLAESINQFMKTMHFSLQFIPDRESGMVIIKVLDGDGNVIRQIPPEVVAVLSSNFGKSIGLLLNTRL